jgi:hypothetical protein
MSSKKADAYTYIYELLKLYNTSFTRQDLMNQARIGGGVADEHIKEMETVGLIVPDGTWEGHTSYRIADPKIEFAHWNKLQPARAF